MQRDLISKLRFWGRHRCPRCRMPLRAEEIACPVCELEIVFINHGGEVMIEMIAVENPTDWRREDVNEYLTMLEVENSGDMYLPNRYLPTLPQRADIKPLPDGTYSIRFHNRVALSDIQKSKLS